MGEKIKTLVLCLLVASSLLLTYFLWQSPSLGQAGYRSEFEPLNPAPPPSLARITAPKRIVYFAGDGKAWMIGPGQDGFFQVWEEVFSLVLSVEDKQGEAVHTTEGKIVFEIEFFTPIPVGELMIYEAVFSKDGESCWLYLVGETTTRYSVEEFAFNNISSLMENAATLLLEPIAEEDMDFAGLKLKEPLLVPSSDLLSLRRVVLTLGDAPLNALFRSVFIDPMLVRRVVRDTDEIFTDGIKGLRVTNEYIELTTVPSEAGIKSLSPKEALERGADLVNLYWGWPQDYFLTCLDEQSQDNYRLILSPVFSGFPARGLDLRLNYTSRGATSFYLPMWERAGYQESIPLPPATAAVKAVAEVSAALGETPQSVLEIEVVYLPRRADLQAMILEPAWEVVLDTGSYYVDADCSVVEK